LLALKHLRKGGASECINLGNGEGYSVLEVIEAARRITGREIKIQFDEPRAGDPSRLVANSAKRVRSWAGIQFTNSIRSSKAPGNGIWRIPMVMHSPKINTAKTDHETHFARCRRAAELHEDCSARARDGKAQRRTLRK
jgi:hypothetical protein